jgi:hypothetical protein
MRLERASARFDECRERMRILGMPGNPVEGKDRKVVF